MPVKPEVRILEDPDHLYRGAAAEFVRRAAESVEARGIFTVALSGGSTPGGLYALLAGEGPDAVRTRIPWQRIRFFWGDERHVPPDHPESNYRLAHDTLLSRVPVPASHIHRIPAEGSDPHEAAEAYAKTLREHVRPGEEGLPRLDLVLLGMGPDGHTASLFPGSGAVHERERLVAAPWIEKLRAYRITLTPPVLNNAACVLFLVAGADKAETLQAVLSEGDQPDRFPAQIIRPTNGELLWLVDRAAGRRLAGSGVAGN